MSSSKWIATKRFPLTEAMRKSMSPTAKVHAQPQIVSKQLCADILERVSPYLRRNSPVDVLDLWPSSGLFSTKIHEFLRPRRHVLVEPNLKSYGRFLKPLARSKPEFELLSFDIYKQKDWLEIFQKHLPEQKPPQGQQVGLLPKNDTLLVLANPPSAASDKDHYTPGRWWCTVMENCIQQTGLHSYGSVRILASFSPKDMWGILPRSVGERKRAAILTENVAQHALELAKYPEVEVWMPLRRLGEIEADRERVAARTAAQNIKIPPKRELPPAQLAPTFSSATSRAPPIPYEPRVRTEWHEGIMKTIEADKVVNGKPKCKVARKAGHTARQQLRQDNRYAWVRASLTEKQLEIDDRMRELARVAASPGEDGSRIKSLDEEIQQLKGGLAQMMSKMHHRDYRQWPRTLDDSRLEALANHNKAHVLPWARRPFEALCIAEPELFPRAPRTMLYFEADENPPAMQKLRGMPEQKEEELLQLFDSLSFVFGTHGSMSVRELLEAIFPGTSINDLVRRIPSLAPHAAKRARGDEYRSLPLDDPTLDPVECYQDNLDYDLSDARLRCLPITTLWDILMEYQKHSLGLSSLQFSRLIGGTMTSFRAGEYGAPTIKLR